MSRLVFSSLEISIHSIWSTFVIKKIIAMNAPMLVGVAMVAFAPQANATQNNDAIFNFKNAIQIGSITELKMSSGGIGVTVRAFDPNGVQRKIDKDLLLGIGVDGTKPGFLGIPIPDLNKGVDVGEYLRFDFSQAVTLTDFDLWDLPLGSNKLSINGKTFSTNGTGSFASLGSVTSLTFKSISDDFRVQTLSVKAVVPAIPEPSTYALMLLGLAGVATVASRKKA